jgi:hypothetical protein
MDVLRAGMPTTPFPRWQFGSANPKPIAHARKNLGLTAPATPRIPEEAEAAGWRRAFR